MNKPVLLLALMMSFPVFADEACPESPLLASAGGHESSGGRPVPPQSIEIRFPSNGTGADSVAYEALLPFITEGFRNGSLSKVVHQKWGREGERTVCLQFDSFQNQNQAYDEILKVVCDARNSLKMSPQFKRRAFCLDEDYGVPPASF